MPSKSQSSEILSAIEKFPKEIQRRNGNIISQVRNPRSGEKIINELKSQYGEDYEV